MSSLLDYIPEVGDIMQYSDLTPWEDVKILRVWTWALYGEDKHSYDIRFEDGFEMYNVDPLFLRPKV